MTKVMVKIMVGVGFNEVMKKWETFAVIGNMDSEAEAKALADLVHEILWSEFSVSNVEEVKEH